ncbi:hypothetical protein HOG21_03295 [bacterium]|nr:hypothetical protein [bacterium]
MKKVTLKFIIGNKRIKEISFAVQVENDVNINHVNIRLKNNHTKLQYIQIKICL